MGANVEIKARVREPERLRRIAEELSGGPPEVLEQEDTFFRVERGRLKLRVFPSGTGEFISYQRVDDGGPTRSDYHIHRTDEPASLLQVLSRSLGVRGVVRKSRHLYLVDQTRVHLDAVEGLGDYLELEVVLQREQTTADGVAIAEALMARLGIATEDLVDVAYIDLLTHER